MLTLAHKREQMKREMVSSFAPLCVHGQVRLAASALFLSSYSFHSYSCGPPGS